jgi:hypothetical protein
MKIKKEYYGVIAGIAVLLILALYLMPGDSGSARVAEEDMTKISKGRGIQIIATYLNPKYEDQFPNSFAFYIQMNTHSGDLFIYDLLELSYLQDGEGNVYKPIRWTESDRSWGHHRSGVLEFQKIDENGNLILSKKDKTFRLVIKGIEFDREFVWKTR